MSDMSPGARALLDAARDGDDPTSADDARIRKTLAAQLGVGLALAASTSATASAAAGGSIAGAAAGGGAGAAAAAGSTVGALVAKIAVMAALAGGAGVGGVAIYQSQRDSSPPSTVMASPAIAAASGKSAPAAMASPVLPPPVAAPSGPPVGAAQGAAPTALVPVLSARAKEPRASAASAIDGETLLVRDAHTALRDGDAARALALLDHHARAYPDGVLAEERAAERVFALCALGRTTDARIAADRFLRDRPQSPLAKRVRSSCGAP